MGGDLSEDNSSSVGALPSPEIMGSFPLLKLLDVQHNRHLVHPFQVRGFFQPRLAIDHSHVASVQRELITAASISPAPPTSSPSLDANGENDLQVFDASDCSTLRLLRVDWMRKGESKEF